MEKNNQSIDFQTQTEIRLLATALLSEEYEIRDEIFSFRCFSSLVGKTLFEKLADVFIKSPNADYSAFLSVLKKDEQSLMVTALQNSPIELVPKDRVTPTLDMLEEIAVAKRMKEQLIDTVLSDDFTAEDIRTIVDNANTTLTTFDSREKYFEEYDKPIDVLPTGYPQLDTLLNGGFEKGTIATIGARPSVGKTTFAINIAIHNSNLKILFFSLEMSAKMVYDKIISCVGDINYYHAIKHNVEFKTVKSILNEFNNLTVIDNISDAEGIVSVIKKIKPDLVFVDYMQIIRTKKDYDMPRQRIDYISQLFKSTAKQINCTIVNLSQLTRSASEEPTMSALKESGGLEQDSDYIILLKRPYVANKSDKNISPSDTTLKLDKNKFGSCGELKYYFDGAHQKFTEKGSSPIAHMKEMKESGQDEDLPF